MFENVIVGVNGEHGGRDAIALAEALIASDGRLTFAHVNSGVPMAAKGNPPEYAPAEREWSLQILEAARAESRIFAELSMISATTVSKGLHQLAERCRSDLLVIGSSHLSAARRIFAGSDPKATVTAAPCAVAIAPSGYRTSEHTFSRIGVAYDHSAESRRALAAGRVLADQFAAKLSAWHAVEVLPFRFISGAKVGYDLLTDVSDEMQHLEGIEPQEIYGDATDALAINSDSVDLLVIGSHDRGPVGRAVHGTTARGLANGSSCPLLVLGHHAGGAGGSGVAIVDESMLERVLHEGGPVG
jgi:nucleotide-binding universal stress UspA family protein